VSNANTYPLPARLGKLIKNEITTLDDNVHPSLLEDVTTESLMKLMKFQLWIAYQIRINKSTSAEEVMSKELNLYEHELGMKENRMVTTQLHTC
jgi:phosphotransferase system HPr-like phosphotransfer protein